MLYAYVCNTCNKTFEIDIPMGNDLPKELECLDRECNGIMKHDFASQVKSQSIDIPPHMQATSRYAPRVKYKKDATTETL